MRMGKLPEYLPQRLQKCKSKITASSFNLEVNDKENIQHCQAQPMEGGDDIQIAPKKRNETRKKKDVKAYSYHSPLVFNLSI